MSNLHSEYARGVLTSLISFNDLRSTPLVTGRIDIQLNVDIPVDTKLVEPLQEGCIWRWARGAATEVSEVEVEAGSTEKVLTDKVFNPTPLPFSTVFLMKFVCLSALRCLEFGFWMHTGWCCPTVV